MSDEFTREIRSSFERAVVVSQPDLSYAAKEKVRDIICTLVLPYPLIKKWYDIVQNVGGIEESSNPKNPDENNDVSNCQCKHNRVTYVWLVEKCIAGGLFAFTDDEVVRNEIDINLSKIASSVYQLYKKTKGRARKDLDERVRKFHVFEGQTMSVIKLREELNNVHNELNNVNDELTEFRKKYENLEKEKEKLYNEMATTIKQKDTMITELQKNNRELEQYAQILENSIGISAYKGKSVSDVKNKTRTLKSFLSRAQVALWFSSSFGIELESLAVKETVSGEIHNLKCEQSIPSEPSDPSNEERNNASLPKFNNLSPEDKTKVEQILFLVDKFCVGDVFYHELSMLVEGLPRSYLVKQCRKELNKMCHIDPLKGEYKGAKVSSVENMFSTHIQDFVEQNPEFNVSADTIKIKISGDGAVMTRTSNFILLSFSLLQTGENVMSAKGNRTIAVVDGKESYETMEESFGVVFQEINKIISNGKIKVDGQDIKTEFFLGGDYKFILLMLGLKGANSDYACAWCKLPKIDRWRMDQHYSYFNTNPLSRSLEEIQELCEKSTNNFCCAKKPLLNIDLNHTIIDELHLLLRVTDVLLENLVNECVNWDKEDEMDIMKGDERGVHLSNLVEVIRSCGVSFNVWEKRDVNGRTSGQYEWTSLMGHDKKILLAELPEKMGLFLHPETSNLVAQIWRDFQVVYQQINKWEPEGSVTEYWIKAKNWIKLFLQLNGKLEGYERKRITPYMHIMVQHVPRFFELHHSIKQFTGQGVEKNNDVARSVVLRKSNKRDSTGDVLRMEQRQWELRGHERKARIYNKTNMGYWNNEIKENRQRLKRQTLRTEASDDCNEQHSVVLEQELPHFSTVNAMDFEKMTTTALREQLKLRSAHGYSKKRKTELIDQLRQICQHEMR
ncbi:uncharacterized protein LOC114541415 [Dendronephthya gigantea]|uniref:uncharacterized protein LOC114541415 n=1 Tax=Dendronephthya gigantea TaxID=151771 RepID=UPI00106B0D38|nr:uncharacterized protein LOC114541415 [Dendronephthya gigantea]